MKEKKKKKGLARLMEIAGQRKGLLIVAGTLSALSSACMLVPYWAVYEVLRLLLTGNAASGEMVHWGWVAFGGLVAGLVLLYLALMASHVAAFNVLYGLRIRITEHIGRLSLGYLNGTTTGAIKKTMEQNVEKIETFIAHTIPDLVGVIGQYITIRNFLERGNAKVVVYDLGSLQLSKEWNQDKISSYFPYYWTDNTVREVVDDCLPEARYLLLSALYQYNSCLHDVFRAYIQKKVVTDGFEELPYTGTTWKPLYYKEKAESYKADPWARSYLDKIVALCKQHGVKLILTMAPGLGSGFKSTQLFLKEYSEANKVLFWDFTDLEALHHDSRYFKDYNHINSEGVKIFTPVIAGKLKSNMGHITD